LSDTLTETPLRSSLSILIDWVETYLSPYLNIEFARPTGLCDFVRTS